MFGENFETQCKLGCWGVGLLSGIGALFLVAGEAGFIAALMIAVALGVFLALVLQQVLCWEDSEEESTVESAGGEAPRAPVPNAPKVNAPKPIAYPSPTPPQATAPKANVPTAELPEPRLPNAANPLNARAGTSGGASDVGAGAETKSSATVGVEERIPAGARVDKGGNAAASAVDPTFTSGTTDAEAGANVKAAPEHINDGTQDGENKGTKPAGLDGPRDGKADNLKEIKGVGPKLEKLLHSMGFYHFDQIANWSADEVTWVDTNLKGFKGRVSRDNWIDQAKVLAAGGETEFSKRVDEGDVY